MLGPRPKGCFRRENDMVSRRYGHSPDTGCVANRSYLPFCLSADTCSLSLSLLSFLFRAP